MFPGTGCAESFGFFAFREPASPVPMTDLYVAMTTMGLISIVVGVIAGRVAHPSGDRLVLALTVWLVAMLGVVWFSVGQLYWAKWIESSAVIAWSNFSPLFLAVAAGWAWRLPERPAWRRGIFAALLASIAVVATLWPVLGPVLRPPSPGNDLWIQGVKRQSDWANCSPAAAATLLKSAGIGASEPEMIELCLTDSAGTPTLGLYRGLALKARSSGREVAVVTDADDAWLEQHPWPALLLVKLPERGVDDPRYESEWGWVPGLGHTVVCFGEHPEGGWMIGDPAYGRERWRKQDLDILWHGRALRVTDRPSAVR